MQLHGLALKLGLTQELMMNNSLVDMYSKCGCLPEAQVLFDMIDNKNVVSWNSMMGDSLKKEMLVEHLISCERCKWRRS
ncbi:hypothetical protein L6164_011294 [Bauhinia variegata]|uniref:Uncharacterized protein n=1 Tax=Bauhinia variegata TaxID=167791 RepID=A0ACB9P675_BAUVA|nr:hypothetical protein L6164_011294 [Bauhinia variegata]